MAGIVGEKTELAEQERGGNRAQDPQPGVAGEEGACADETEQRRERERVHGIVPGMPVEESPPADGAFEDGVLASGGQLLDIAPDRNVALGDGNRESRPGEWHA